MSLGAIGNAVGAAFGSGASTAKTVGKPKFLKGEPYALSSEIDPQTGEFAPQNQNELNTREKVHFIHYGRDHIDSDKSFKGGGAGGAADATQNRGLIFRDCLVREAVLLHGFIFSTRAALKEYKEELGLAGMAGAALDFAFGGAKSAEPDDAELDTFMTRVADLAKKINVTDIAYPDLHEAGREFHQIRADYRAFTDEMVKYYVDQVGKSPGILGSAMGVANTVRAAIPDSVRIVLEMPVKMFDIWLAMYLYMCLSVEDELAGRSYKLSMDGITKEGCSPPTFPLWHNKAKDAAADDKVIGYQYVEDAFTFFKGVSVKPDPAKSQNPQTGTSDVYQFSFVKAMEVSILPNLLKKSIDIFSERTLAFMKQVYLKIAEKEETTIDQPFLMKTAREQFARIVLDLGEAIGLGRVGNKAKDLLKDLESISMVGKAIQDKRKEGQDDAASKHIPYLDDVLERAIGKDPGAPEAGKAPDGPYTLVSIFRQAHDDAKKQEALTMEVYLSRLPWLMTLMFRNVFFPLWSALLEVTVGKIGGPYKTMMDALGTAGEWAGRGKGYAKDAAGIAKQGDKENFVKDLVGDESKVGKILGALGGTPGPAFPLESRKKDGKGKEIVDADNKAVEKEQDKVTKNIAEGDGQTKAAQGATAAPGSTSASSPTK